MQDETAGPCTYPHSDSPTLSTHALAASRGQEGKRAKAIITRAGVGLKLGQRLWKCPVGKSIERPFRAGIMLGVGSLEKFPGTQAHFQTIQVREE